MSATEIYRGFWMIYAGDLTDQTDTMSSLVVARSRAYKNW